MQLRGACPASAVGARTQVNLLASSSSPTSRNWFPHLQELRLLEHVAASDADLPALTALTALTALHLHLQKPSRGLAGRVTLRGLWGLAQSVTTLQEIRLTGAMETTLMVPEWYRGTRLGSGSEEDLGVAVVRAC